MTDSQIIEALGGTNAVARIFQIKPGSVSGWKKNGIPQSRKQTLALMYPGKFPCWWAPSAANKAGDTAA